MIDTYAQDLGIQSRELARVGFVRRDLARSDGRPGLREKHQDDVFPTVVAERYVLIQMRRQGEIWSLLPDIQLHNRLLSGVLLYPENIKKMGSQNCPLREMD